EERTPASLLDFGLCFRDLCYNATGKAPANPGREHVMTKERGRSYPLSPFRRLVTDLMGFSQKVPAVTAERRINLSALMEARQNCPSRPSWAVLFAKAFALVARSRH